MISFVRYKTQTDEQGKAVLTVKVPGTFTTISPNDPLFSGRRIVDALVSFSDSELGDAVTSFSLKDLDGLLPVEMRPLFPEYPVLGKWSDPEVELAENRGAWIPKNAWFSFSPPPTQDKVASGMYMVIEAEKATPLVATLYAIGKWDDLK